MNQLLLLTVTGSVCLIITLLEAWSLTGIRHLNWQFCKRWFPSDQNLLKSHLDYLMMCTLLFASAALLDLWQVNLSLIVLWSACLGSLLNPFGFLLMAVKPDIAKGGNKLFSAAMATSFLLTTIGYMGIGISLIMKGFSG